MKNLSLFLMLLITLVACDSNTEKNGAADVPVEELIDLPLARQLHDFHPYIKYDSIRDRRFKYEELKAVIASLDPAVFSVKKAGSSIEGRDIFLIKMGEGPVRVLLWSQMHGDESTATMALVDMFRFFQQKEQFQEFVAMLHNELSLYFIPMLNPDGAERFQRRNALGVDLNRDALRLQSPEARILKHTRDSLDADWGFNLHDQNRYYATGNQPHMAGISFLAPAYNYEKDINEKRAEAMKLIVGMNAVLQTYIPDKVGRYSDAFEPRAFGDNIQKWGTRTILIESGSLREDREKQYLRQLNFTILLSAFNEIAKAKVKDFPLEPYEEIPFNNSNAFQDLIIRKATRYINDQPYLIDLAFRNNEIGYAENQQYYFRSTISDLGDLSTQYGYEELNAEGLVVSIGKTYPREFNNLTELESLNLTEQLRKGYTDFIVKKAPAPWQTDRMPVRILPRSPSEAIEVGDNPSLLLSDEDGEVKWVVINGFFHSLDLKGLKDL